MKSADGINPPRDLFSGNEIRHILTRYGFPNPDRRLIDAMAPIQQESVDGTTLRTWAVRKDVIAGVFASIKADLDELEMLRYGDAGIFETKLKGVVEKFYQELAKARKADSSTA